MLDSDWLIHKKKSIYNEFIISYFLYKAGGGIDYYWVERSERSASNCTDVALQSGDGPQIQSGPGVLNGSWDRLTSHCNQSVSFCQPFGNPQGGILNKSGLPTIPCSAGSRARLTGWLWAQGLSEVWSAQVFHSDEWVCLRNSNMQTNWS